MAFKNINIPPQVISVRSKTKKWREKHLDWAESKSFLAYSPTRISRLHKKRNYDLINGKLDMKDLMSILNPTGMETNYSIKQIQHYPLMNNAINTLRGEGQARVFDYRVVITNPTGISDVENKKKEELFKRIQSQIQNISQSEEDFNKNMEEIAHFFKFEYQDAREQRANHLLNHYSKEYNMPLMFTDGLVDAMVVGEEIYQCDIENGEPVVRRLNPCKLTAFRSGYSSNIEDADIILYEDYWSPGKIIDVYHEYLTPKDVKWLCDMDSDNDPDAINGNYGDHPDGGKWGPDPMNQFYKIDYSDPNWDLPDFAPTLPPELQGLGYDSYNATDQYGNVRVLKMFWKSKRKIKKVKSFDSETGDEMFKYYDESYILDKDKGETEEIFWINQAWEGVKIGRKIYVNIGPRKVQYNRLSNPSRCHFGIVGSIYNINETKPFSLVDMMKPYNYLYDVIQDRLNRMLDRDWGNLLRIDVSKKPNIYTDQEWISIAKNLGIMIENSFNEGQSGAARGKLAAALNNNTTGAINLSQAQIISAYMQMLDYIEQKTSNIIGMTPQRLGQIQNRETVGGVERATLQSSYITQWIYQRHDDNMKRVYECFLETAKIALRGKNKKFQYILGDNSKYIAEIDGDMFSECDYGLVVDCSDWTQKLSQKIDQYSEIALQSQMLPLSACLDLYKTCSLAEKIAMMKKAEDDMNQRQQQQEQQAQQLQQQQLQQAQQQFEMQQQQAQQQFEANQANLEAERQLKDQINMRDNATRVEVEQIRAANQTQNNEFKAYQEELQKNFAEENRIDLKELDEKKRQFDDKMKLEREKFEHEVANDKVQNDLKREQIRRQAILKRMSNNK